MTNQTYPFTDQEFNAIQNTIHQAFMHPVLQDESDDILEINNKHLIKSEDAYRFGKTFSIYKNDKNSYVYELKDEDSDSIYFNIESNFEDILEHLNVSFEADIECIEQQL